MKGFGMAKASSQKAKTETEPELLPDAWDRFERAVDVVAKSAPMHRAHKAPDDPPKALKPKKDKPAK